MADEPQYTGRAEFARIETAIEFELALEPGAKAEIKADLRAIQWKAKNREYDGRDADLAADLAHLEERIRAATKREV